jgi:hypothetical protein
LSVDVMTFTLLGYWVAGTVSSELTETFLEVTAAVGEVLDEPPAKLREDVLQRASMPALADVLHRSVVALGPVLSSRSWSQPPSSRLGFDHASRLCGVARGLAKRLAVLISFADPDTRWVDLLKSHVTLLRQAPAAACLVPHDTRVLFEREPPLEPLDEDTARETAAALLGLVPHSVDERWLVTELLHDPQGAFRVSKELRALLVDSEGVAGVETLEPRPGPG